MTEEPKLCKAEGCDREVPPTKGRTRNFCCRHCGLFPRMCSGCSKKISRQATRCNKCAVRTPSGGHGKTLAELIEQSAAAEVQR